MRILWGIASLGICACRIGFAPLAEAPPADAPLPDSPLPDSPPASAFLSYPTAEIDAVLGQTNISLQPTASPEMVFSVDPALPAGVQIDPTSGFIGGTPTEVVDQGTYTVTGTAPGGSATAVLLLSVLPGSVVDSVDDFPDVDLSDNKCATQANRCTLRAAIQTANTRTGKQRILLDAKTYALDTPLAAINVDLEIAGTAPDRGITGTDALPTVIRPIYEHPNWTAAALTLDTDHTLRIKRISFHDFGLFDGAVLDVVTGKVEVDTAWFENNMAASQGGVIHVGNAARVTFRRSTFVRNHAGPINNGFGTGEGGVINSAQVPHDQASQILVTGCTAMENTANFGSFAFIRDGSSLEVENSTIYGNVVSTAGTLSGAGGTIRLRNDTIVFNRSLFDPPDNANTAGLDLSVLTFYDVSNTIIAFNTDKTDAENNCNRQDGTLASEGGNIISDNAGTCASAFDRPGDRLSTDPGLVLGAPSDHGGWTKTILLTMTSNALDGAQAASCPAEDQRGHPRSGADSGKCDVGAVEMP
ncbi:MAG TPA: choice-of-anchor Q domain-containing protein [Kofleriaceae bacterium]